jgi:hypothetical protein
MSCLPLADIGLRDTAFHSCRSDEILTVYLLRGGYVEDKTSPIDVSVHE